MASVMNMDEDLIRGRAWGDPAWAVQQILSLRSQLRTAEAAITDLALPRIAELEAERARLINQIPEGHIH
jgi:hypothetical protein